MTFLANASRLSRHLILLAPHEPADPRSFSDVQIDKRRYQKLFRKMQEFRGALYLLDDAIDSSQLRRGRHEVAIDAGSWHLLVVDDQGTIFGCARYREYPRGTTFSQLSVARSALARCSEWGAQLLLAVESEIELSARLNVPYVELGGWALATHLRGSIEAFRMALATYGLSQLLGGAVGISTVTRRHCSASILRRIGGRSLDYDGCELPIYYDPQYKCEMEVLRFYSWSPSSRYEAWIREMSGQLREVQVLSDGASAPAWRAWNPPEVQCLAAGAA